MTRTAGSPASLSDSATRDARDWLFNAASDTLPETHVLAGLSRADFAVAVLNTVRRLTREVLQRDDELFKGCTLLLRHGPEAPSAS